MATKVFISTFIQLLLWEHCSAWEKITSLKTTPISGLQEGGTVTISCKANNWWNTCELIHNSQKCTQENGGGWTNKIGDCNKSYDKRIKMVGEYRKQHYECAFELSEVTLEDAGEWICRLNMYSSGQWSEKRTNLLIEPQYELSIEAEPSTGLEEGGNVIISCTPNHPWETCVLEFNGGNCTQTLSKDKAAYELSQCDDHRINIVGNDSENSNNECKFKLRGAKLEDAGNWKCHLVMVYNKQWIEKTTTISVEPHYEVNLEVEPLIGIEEGGNVTFSCTSSHQWRTCVLLHSGNHCEQTYGGMNHSQCTDSRITKAQSLNQCIFELRGVIAKDAGSWKCDLEMDHDQEWIERETSIEIRQPRNTRHEDHPPTKNPDATQPNTDDPPTKNPDATQPNNDDPTTAESSDATQSNNDDPTTSSLASSLGTAGVISAIVLVLVLLSVLFVVKWRKSSSSKASSNSERKEQGNVYNPVNV